MWQQNDRQRDRTCYLGYLATVSPLISFIQATNDFAGTNSEHHGQFQEVKTLELEIFDPNFFPTENNNTVERSIIDEL